MPRVAKKKAAKKPKAVVEAEAEAEALAETVTIEEIVPAMAEAVPMPEVPVLPVIVLPTCVLDDAPVNSKVVMVQQDTLKIPVMTTPDGLVAVPADDIVRKLPEGAKIMRRGPTMFVAEQLNPTIGHPPLVTTTAREAITRFLAHFHNVKD